MTKRFIATALAASMALTSLSATPVRADSGEIGRLLLGAGALLIIGSAISNNNNRQRDRDPVVTTRRNYEQPYRVKPRHEPHRVKPRRKVVPSECLRVNRRDDGPRRFFGQRCLQNNMRYVDRLPGYCLRTIRGKHGRRNVYAARCLRRDGWTFG